MKVGVLALQGDVREHARALAAEGATPIEVRTPEELASVDAVVLPGGESTTIGKLLERFELLAPLRDRITGGMPVFGTCAGMILLARDVEGKDAAPLRLGTLGVTVVRNAYGRQVGSFETDLDVAGMGKVRGAFIRAPAIESHDEDVEVLAVHDGRPVLVRQGKQLAASFHPEITGETRVHRSFLELLEQ